MSACPHCGHAVEVEPELPCEVVVRLHGVVLMRRTFTAMTSAAALRLVLADMGDAPQTMSVSVRRVYL
jgi:hypothetical protein